MENTTERFIVSNRIRTPDGTILISRHRHDFNSYVDDNGSEYFVDGGNEYLRRGWSEGAPPYTELSVYSDESHEVIREVFLWGTRGKTGLDPVKYVPLHELEDSHIRAILDTQWQLSEGIKKIFSDELKTRGL